MTVFLALGSNLGDRIQFLGGGLRALARRGLTIERVSSVVETRALGQEDQPPFLNLVAACAWKGRAEDLLDVIRRVEEEAGRTRPFPGAPRTLDVDLVFFGTLIIRNPDLRVPHPRWKDRSFVARPLQQLAPELVDPESGLRVREVNRFWPQEPKRMKEVIGMANFLWTAP